MNSGRKLPAKLVKRVVTLAAETNTDGEPALSSSAIGRRLDLANVTVGIVIRRALCRLVADNKRLEKENRKLKRETGSCGE